MRENKNDSHYGQTSSDEQRNLERESTQGNMTSEGRSSGLQPKNESYEQEDSDAFMGQEHNRVSQSNDRSMGREGTDSSQMGRSGSSMGQTDQEEYTSDEEIDDLDDMEDDEMVSRVDEEEELDIFEDDENSQSNLRGTQDSGFGSGSTR